MSDEPLDLEVRFSRTLRLNAALHDRRYYWNPWTFNPVANHPPEWYPLQPLWFYNGKPTTVALREEIQL